MKTATLLALVCLAQIVWCSTNCSPVQDASVRRCYLAFFAHYNFSDVPAYAAFASAHAALVHAQGLQGEQQACEWVKARHQCIADAHASGCVSIGDWERALGLGQQDSYSFLSDYAVENYECGPGYEQLKRNFVCLATVTDKFGAQLQACAANFTAAQQQHFECGEVVQYINCFTKVYLRGCNTDGANFACSLAEVAMNAVVPQCASGNPVCPQPAPVRPFRLNFV